MSGNGVRMIRVDMTDQARRHPVGEVVGLEVAQPHAPDRVVLDHVEGELLGEYDALDAFATHLWACTVSGSPKPMALQTIEDMENSPRRWYAGAIGYLSLNGNLNTGMTWRTVHLEKGRAMVRAPWLPGGRRGQSMFCSNRCIQSAKRKTAKARKLLAEGWSRHEVAAEVTETEVWLRERGL